MVLVYHGKVPELQQQVEESKWRVNQAYLEIFGNEAYSKLERAVGRILTPESFIETLKDLKRVAREDFPETTPSKFMFASLMDLKIDKDGRIGNKHVRMGCGFYITPQSFQHSGSSDLSEKIIASYIHEYDHFVPMVLQRTPLYLANAYLTNSTGPVYTLEQLSGLISDMENNEKLSMDERRLRVLCGGMAYSLFDVWEKATRILDKIVLERIGIDVPLPFRGIPKQYLYHQSPKLNLVTAIPQDGDSFLGLSDVEAVRRVVKWEEYFHSRIKYPYTENLYETLKNVNVEYTPFMQLLREASDKKKTTKKGRRTRRREEQERKERRKEERREKRKGR